MYNKIQWPPMVLSLTHLALLPMVTTFDWPLARQMYETGESVSAIARRIGCSRTAVAKRATIGKWARPQTLVPTPLCEMVAGFGDTGAGIASSADVLQRHRIDWARLRPLHELAIKAAQRARIQRALECARIIRLLVDTTKILQAGERTAWAIERSETPLDAVSDEELDQEIAAAAERIAARRLH